jgi:hypothetical protein
MAVTAFPSMGESPDLTLLNVARLFTRLEHNLLSPGSELRILRRSEFQRMRVTKVGSLFTCCVEVMGDDEYLTNVPCRMSNMHARFFPNWNALCHN